MGSLGLRGLVTMQFLILASGLVAYPNGAVAPFDPNNAAATKEHFEALSEAGAVVNPYFTHAQGLVAPYLVPQVLYGRKKRQAIDADGLVTYPNGARAPFDPNVALATANHYAAKALASPFPLVGAANVHPPAVPAVYGYPLLGRKRRSADAQLLASPLLGLPYAAGYPVLPYALPYAPLVAHPNGAVVPLEPKDVVDARAEHLQAVADALKPAAE